MINNWYCSLWLVSLLVAIFLSRFTSSSLPRTLFISCPGIIYLYAPFYHGRQWQYNQHPLSSSNLYSLIGTLCCGTLSLQGWIVVTIQTGGLTLSSKTFNQMMSANETVNIIEDPFLNHEMKDIHLACALANGNSGATQRLHRQTVPRRCCQAKATFAVNRGQLAEYVNQAMFEWDYKSFINKTTL